MAIDFGGVAVGDNYSSAFVPKLNEVMKGVASLLDPAVITYTGTPPTGAFRLSSASNALERFNGTSWVGQAVNGVALSSGNPVPTANGTISLGTASLRWASVNTIAVADGGDQLLGSSSSTVRHGFGSFWTQHQFAVGGTAKVYVTSTGLGIGASPVTALDVSGSGIVAALRSSTARGSGNNYLQFYDPTGAKGYVGYGGGNDKMQVAQLLNADLDFYVNNNLALSLLASNNSAYFHYRTIYNASASSGAFNEYRVANVAYGYIGHAVGVVGSGSGMAIRSETDLTFYAGGTRGVVNSTGNWSFNAPSSGYTLSVAGSAALALSGSGAVIDFTNSGSAPAQLNYYGTNNLELVTRNASGGIAFYTGAAQLRGQITNNGRWSFNGGAYTVALTPTHSVTPTFDANLSNVWEPGVLTSSITSMTISNAVAGQTIQIRFKQDGTGGRTIAVPSGAKITGSPVTAANRVSILTMTYSGVDSRWEGTWLQVPA